MKKYLTILPIVIVLTFIFTKHISAQGMMNRDNNSSASSPEIAATSEDEQKGKQIWDQLQSNQTSCGILKDADFEVLGEYFMGQSVGNTERHAAMNRMMKNMMGDTAEEQMHISLGKRSSGCDANASFPSGYGLPMMSWMMGGGGSPMMGYGGWNGWGNMMGWGRFGWILMLFFWILVVLTIVALIRYLTGSKRNTDKDVPLNILRARYAKGDISKKEFDKIKNDIR